MRTTTERPTGRVTMIMAFVVALVAASCGGDATEDFRATLIDDGFTEAQADCVLDGFDETGIDPADLTDEALGDDAPPAEAIDITVGCLTGVDPSTVLDDVDVSDIDIDLGDIEVDVEMPELDLDLGDIDTAGLTAGGYGDDPALDALWDACAAGDGQACDDLYWSSAVDSAYEAFGNTCGERFEVGPPSCAAELG